MIKCQLYCLCFCFIPYYHDIFTPQILNNKNKTIGLDNQLNYWPRELLRAIPLYTADCYSVSFVLIVFSVLARGILLNLWLATRVLCLMRATTKPSSLVVTVLST